MVITVAPSPHLTVAYTLPRSVADGKDARIRVTVQNIGAGLARNLSIESLQPRIVENANNLPIGFTITGSSNTADGSTFEPGNLNIQFGDIAPGGTVAGYWTLRAARRGYLIDAEVSKFTHEDYKGVKLDALVDTPTISFVGSIGGRVTVNGPGNVPASGLVVTVGGQSDTTDAAGNYFVQDLVPGHYTLTVSVPNGSVLVSSGVDILPDQANDFLDLMVTLVEPSVTLTSPNGGESWPVGTTQTIQFTYNVGAGQSVALEVSRDSGATWSPLASVTTTSATSLAYAWLVSGPTTTHARIRARLTSSPSVADASDGDFRTTYQQTDLNGDGVPDLVLQSDATRQVVALHMSGPQGNVILSATALLSTGLPGWSLVAVSDSNRDGMADMVLQEDTTRRVLVIYLGGANRETVQGADWLLQTGAPGWRVAAMGDFDGNGTPDLVLQQDTTRQALVLYMGGASGNTVLRYQSLSQVGIAGWTIVGAADLDKNGKLDILREEDTTRRLAVVYMGGADGNEMQGSGFVLPTGLAGWHAVGAADFDRNGTPDVVLQRDQTREVIVLYLGGSSGITIQGANVLLSTPLPGWRAVVR